jgi:hypothetical protein
VMSSVEMSDGLGLNEQYHNAVSQNMSSYLYT